MAVVRRCDVCGAIYDIGDENVKYAGDFTVHNRKFDFGDRTDCCPDCTNKINSFIRILKGGLSYRLYIDDFGGGIADESSATEVGDAACQE